uniref:DUF406 family protein n=1 Tax=Escherichia coli TaxID=562 RepID=UPI0021A910B8
ADRNRSHWSTSKTPSYTKSVSWQHHLAAAASSADEGASVAYKIKDLEGQVELDAAFTFSCQAEMIIFELSLRSLA